MRGLLPGSLLLVGLIASSALLLRDRPQLPEPVLQLPPPSETTPVSEWLIRRITREKIRVWKKGEDNARFEFTGDRFSASTTGRFIAIHDLLKPASPSNPASTRVSGLLLAPMIRDSKFLDTVLIRDLEHPDEAWEMPGIDAVFSPDSQWVALIKLDSASGNGLGAMGFSFCGSNNLYGPFVSNPRLGFEIWNLTKREMVMSGRGRVARFSQDSSRIAVIEPTQAIRPAKPADANSILTDVLKPCSAEHPCRILTAAEALKLKEESLKIIHVGDWQAEPRNDFHGEIRDVSPDLRWVYGPGAEQVDTEKPTILSVEASGAIGFEFPLRIMDRKSHDLYLARLQESPKSLRNDCDRSPPPVIRFNEQGPASLKYDGLIYDVNLYGHRLTTNGKRETNEFFSTMSDLRFADADPDLKLFWPSRKALRDDSKLWRSGTSPPDHAPGTPGFTLTASANHSSQILAPDKTPLISSWDVEWIDSTNTSFSRDHRLLFSVGRSTRKCQPEYSRCGTAWLWELPGGKELHRLDFTEQQTVITLPGQDRLLFVHDKTIEVWELRSWLREKTISVKTEPYTTRLMRVSSDGRRALLGWNSWQPFNFWWLDLETGTAAEGNSECRMDAAEDLSWLVGCDQHEFLNLWSPSGNQLTTRRVIRTGRPMSAAAYDPERHRFAVKFADWESAIIDEKSGQVRMSLWKIENCLPAPASGKWRTSAWLARDAENHYDGTPGVESCIQWKSGERLMAGDAFKSLRIPLKPDTVP
jgi:hypothetical protein